MRILFLVFALAAMPYILGQLLQNAMDAQLQPHEEWVMEGE